MPGLGFLSPAFLLAALAVALPIALHLYRRRTDAVVDFPAARLIEQAPVERQRRRRLREVVLLALRVAALLLLALSFARPYRTDDASPGAGVPVTIVALDTSMSMTAPGQWARAREAARRAVAEAPTGGRVGLLLFDDAVSLAVPPTADRDAVRGAIDAARPGVGATRYPRALAAAADALGGHDGRIVVVTDLQESGWDGAAPGALADEIEVIVTPVSPAAANLAVTTARREGGAVLAAIQHYGREAARTTVRLRVGDRDVASQPVELPPMGSLQVRLEAGLPDAGGASVSVDDAVGYQPDNTRFLVLDPPAPVPAAIVTADPTGTRGGLYFDRALSTVEESTGLRASLVDGRAMSAWPAPRVREQAFIALLGTSTLDRQGRAAIRAYVNEGGRALVVLGEAVDVDTLSDTLGVDLGVAREPTIVRGAPAALVARDARHPIFRPFVGAGGGLGDAHVSRYRAIADRTGAVLAQFSGGAPALIERPVGRGRILVFASDLDNVWNRFPLNPAFVPFALETARYLSQGRERAVEWTLPERPREAPAAPGVHTLPGNGGPDRRIAINVDTRESNPSAGAVDAFLAAVPRTSATRTAAAGAAPVEREREQRLWQVGLVLMLLALAGEALVGRKAA